MVISGMGMELGGVKFNGTKGFQIQQGQRKAMEGDDLKAVKDMATTFPELLLINNKDVVLKGIETVNGSDAYALTFGKRTMMYDVKSGLKVAESVEQEQMGQKMTQTTNFNDYKEVKGIKFPYNTVMNVGLEIEFVTQDIKINEGVTNADFE
jgi:hypothetical protein